MPPARPSSAAAEETTRRARGSGTSQRGRNRSDAGVPPASSGGPADSAGNVDWDAIFATIDGQAGQGQGRSGETRQQQERGPTSLQQGFEFPPGRDQGVGSTPMSAGPSSSSQQHPRSHFPFESSRHNNEQQPWSSNPYAGMDGPGDRPDQLPFGESGPSGPSSRGASPHRPPQPSRSQSYPFYNDPFSHTPFADQPFPQQQQSMMPPPSGIGPFGMGMASEPNSFGSGSGSSIASLLNNPFQNFNYTPLTSPTHPPDQNIPRGMSNMDPPPVGSHRGHSSISHNPYDFSGQTSVNPSPAPTPLSNPPSGEDSEDKRVRNTVASAKFRAKKKEQIASVQRTISELEVQHAGLEADVASLRNENGLLREMVQIKFGTKIPDN